MAIEAVPSCCCFSVAGHRRPRLLYYNPNSIPHHQWRRRSSSTSLHSRCSRPSGDDLSVLSASSSSFPSFSSPSISSRGVSGCLIARASGIPGPTGDEEGSSTIRHKEKEGRGSVGADRSGFLMPEQEDELQPLDGVAAAIREAMPTKGFVTVAACVVGLLTGLAVVLFNTSVHEIRDLFWDGLPSRGASWLREEPLEEIWQRVILVPVCGGIIVGMLNALRSSLRSPSEGIGSNIKGVLRPLLKAIAASVTLGTGNSLGPEGPNVEIGSSIAKGVVSVFACDSGTSLSLIAAGSAAGISSGFNASVAGCFFAVESVLWPSSADSFSSLSSSTSMVILSSVIASVVSEVGLGSDPAFTVPDYDFRSASELPLYLLLGILCGMVSITLSGCTSLALKAFDYLQRTTGLTKATFPALGGLSVGVLALSYPEVLYWGFENVDILLESRPFVNGLPAITLFQLVVVKIFATSLSRASGLVGGYYAPSLFIGAATGMAYGKFMASVFGGPNPLFHLSIVELASPQAYGLVGMAATLAGVCQVPLTSVLLLFELTQDYHIVLPLLGAVGLSSWISSSQNITRIATAKLDKSKNDDKVILNAKDLQYGSQNSSSSSSSIEAEAMDLCNLETSLCVYDTSNEVGNFADKQTVSQAMRTKYLTVLMNTLVVEVVTLMQVEKQSCVVILDNDNSLVGILALEDIQRFAKSITRGTETEVGKILISHVCHAEGGKYKALTVTPEMTLLAVENIMNLHGVNHLPVAENTNGQIERRLVGLLDRDCISITRRVAATKEYLDLSLNTRPE